MAEQDPYEQWKAMGRPGGNFDAWMAEQGGGQEPAPPAGGQPPAQSSGGQQAGGSQSWNWTPDARAAERAWNMGVQRGEIPAGTPKPSGQGMLDWFKNAVEAGAYLETGESSSDTAYESSGWNSKGQDITGYRKMAREGNWSEDMDRWSEGQLMSWSKNFDPTCPPGDPFRSFHDGSCVQKPIDSGGSTMPGGERNPNWKPGGEQEGGGGGGGRGGQQKPPDPTTMGKQLSMTGDPMQDMLIQQFNTGQNSTYGQGMNIFGLGEDRAVGGTGANADMKPGEQQNTAQSLRGGGLWYGQDPATFSGWDASKDKGIAGEKQTGEQRQAEKAYDKGKGDLAAPVGPREQTAQVDPRAGAQTARASSQWELQDRRRNVNRRPRTVSGMLTNNYGSQGGSYF